MRVILVLCSLFALSWGQATTGTVLDYLQRSHKTFVQLVDQAGLTDTLKGAGPFTVFVPSESDLGSLDTSDTAKLAAILKYHIVSGTYKHNDLYNERILDSLQQNQKIRVNHYLSNGAYTVQGQRITSFDRQTGNGILHLIRGVMTPPPGTVLDIVSSHQNLTTLLSAVQQAKFDTFLQDQNPITLFAPTNAAFETLGSGTAQALLQNPALLTAVLKYHAIPGSLYSADYHTASLHTFEEDDKIRLHRFLFFGYEFDSASPVGSDLSATNGVVHLIDHVLIPKSHAAEVQALVQTTSAPIVSDAP